MIKKALISVYEKRGLEALVKALSKLGVEILSSGGTAARVRELGFPVAEVSQYTGYPEAPQGMVKTLHPKIHGGILLNPSDPQHGEYMRKLGVEKIDMVVVNFYPLPGSLEGDGEGLRSLAENIDIGGPALARAAAKAALLYGAPVVITETGQYGFIINELARCEGNISGKVVRGLALKAFERTRAYEEAVVSRLRRILGGRAAWTSTP